MTPDLSYDKEGERRVKVINGMKKQKTKKQASTGITYFPHIFFMRGLLASRCASGTISSLHFLTFIQQLLYTIYDLSNAVWYRYVIRVRVYFLLVESSNQAAVLRDI